MASVIWDDQKEIMIDYLEQGRTIDGAYYACKLKTVRKTDSQLPTRHKLP